MIMTTEELRRYVTTDDEDQALEAKLSALELLIRAYTHNNFQKRGFRRMGDIFQGTVVMNGNPFKAGDTVLLPKYGGTEVKLDGKKLQLVREEDLLGVLEK